MNTARKVIADCAWVWSWLQLAWLIMRSPQRPPSSRAWMWRGWWLALALCIAPSVRADDVCSATWSARLESTRGVLATRNQLMQRGRTGFAAAQFYFAHCRDMSRLERAVRRADDVNAFTCSPEAGARPKLLTPQFTRDWLANFGQFPDPDAVASTWLALAIEQVEIVGAADIEADNAQCAASDVAAGRIALTLDAPSQLERALAAQSVLVWGCSKRSCIEAQQQIDAVRAKLATGGAR